MNEEVDTPILGVRNIAAELGYTVQQVRHLNKSGELPTTMVGARVATTRKLLKEWRVGVEERARRQLADRQGGNGRAVAGMVIERMNAKMDGAEAV